MATRGSPSRRIPGNPLGGILRDSARAARTVTGPLSGGGASVYADTSLTDENGKVFITFPTPFVSAPVVQLTVGPAGNGTSAPAVATVLEVTALTLSLVVWTLAGAPAGSGIIVHTTAYERT